MRVRARERRDVDDVASATPLHLRKDSAAAVEDAEQIRLKYRAELFGRRLLDGLEETYARVVDEHVNAAQLFDCVSDERFALFTRAHVARSARRAHAQAFKLAHCLLYFVEAPRADADVQAFARQSLRYRAPDALRTTRDDGRLPLVVHCLLRLQLLFQKLVDHLRIRLALRSLQHLPDEEAEERLLAAAICLDLLRVRFEHGGDYLLNLSCVGHLREPLLFDDGLRALARREHLSEHVLALLATDAPLLDCADECAQLFGRDGRSVCRDTGRVQLAQQFALEPVRRAARVRGGSSALVEVRESAVAHE